MSTNLELAKELLEVLPPSMRRIREELRAGAHEKVTVPQWRILGAIYRGRNETSELAKHHGVSQPAISRMVDGLVDRGLVKRVPHQDDRRHIILSLSRAGESLYKKARKSTQKKIGAKIARLSFAQKSQMRQGLKILRALLLEPET